MRESARKSAIDQNRHLRALCFVLVSLAISLVAHHWLGFNSVQTIGYAVASYLVLTALNYRAMFSKVSPLPDE